MPLGGIVTRLRSLDGLRGLAAFAVIIWHVSLVIPAFSNVVLRGAVPRRFRLEWWLTRTPFADLELGHEAVLVFFILSGFVLTLQVNSAALTGPKVRQYYVRRLARLYLPVWGALFLALLLALLVPRNPEAQSPWLAMHDAPSVKEVVSGLTLLAGSTTLDTPLWSLTLEVWFSLALPVLLVAARLLRVWRWWPVAVGLCIVASASALSLTPLLPASALGLAIQYPPVFMIGVVLALRYDTIAALVRRLPWPLVLVTAAGFTALQSIMVVSEPLEALLRGATLLGLALVVLAAIEYAPFVRMLEGRPTQWLGTRSFSLYLVHEPIVVATALAAGMTTWWPWLGVAGVLVPVVLGVTELFYRTAERPSHLLSKLAGTWALRGRSEATPGAIADVDTHEIPTQLTETAPDGSTVHARVDMSSTQAELG